MVYVTCRGDALPGAVAPCVQDSVEPGTLVSSTHSSLHSAYRQENNNISGREGTATFYDQVLSIKYRVHHVCHET